MQFARQLVTAFLLSSGLTGAGLAADRAIIVLDASGSMWGQIDGKPKLEIARQTLRKVLQTVPGDMELGLMAYGHREKGSCSDIELIVPPKAGSAAEITAAADSMRFLGKTPLSAAVKKAAEDMNYTEDKATVILITDGLETCNADPCALGTELESSGVDFTAHVVGFGLTAEEGKQVACLADNTGGKYIQAGDEKSLEDALSMVVAAPEPEPAPEPMKVEYNLVPTTVLSAASGIVPPIDIFYEVFTTDPAGNKAELLSSNWQGYKDNLPAGDYIITSKSGNATAEQKVTLVADKVAEPLFDLDAGILILRARPSEGADIDGNAQIILDYPGDEEPSAHWGQVTTTVPAGDTRVTVKLGAGEVSETIPVAAGQTVDKDLIIGLGKAQVNAYYSTGGEKVESGDLSWQIFRAAKKIDGSREQVTYSYGPESMFDLPAGDYVATADMQAARAEQPFSIKVGELSDVSVVLDAGLVAINAPGAEGFRIYEARTNLAGERKQITYGYGEALQTTIAAGDYVVATDFSGDRPGSETPFSVKAGERTELAVP